MHWMEQLGAAPRPRQVITPELAREFKKRLDQLSRAIALDYDLLKSAGKETPLKRTMGSEGHATREALAVHGVMSPMQTAFIYLSMPVLSEKAQAKLEEQLRSIDLYVKGLVSKHSAYWHETRRAYLLLNLFRRRNGWLDPSPPKPSLRRQMGSVYGRTHLWEI